MITLNVPHKTKENWNAPFRKIGSSWKGDRLITTRYCYRDGRDGAVTTKTIEMRGMVPCFGNRIPNKKIFGYLEEMSKIVNERR